MERLKASTVDEYIAAFPPEVRAILRQIRKVVRNAAPEAEEGISYGIPAYRLDGVLVYFAAFKKHIGFYPPVRGNVALEKAVDRYAGEKGNLQFPLDEPMPLKLIERITKFRVKQNRDEAATKKRART